MPNIQNLTPFNTMSPEHHRELSAKGGRASGAERRRRAKLRRDMAELYRAYCEVQAEREAKTNREQTKRS